MIGAEVGGLFDEVFEARQGDKIAKKLVHQPDIEHPLKGTCIKKVVQK